MKKFSMTCTCGHEMSVDAATKEEAVAKLQQMMDQKGIDAHWAENHKEDTAPKPGIEQVHAMVAEKVHEVVEVPPAPMPN